MYLLQSQYSGPVASHTIERANWTTSVAIALHATFAARRWLNYMHIAMWYKYQCFELKIANYAHIVSMNVSYRQNFRLTYIDSEW